ncbi:ABC transporter ATP-binding protein [Nocardia sp. CNY236]|uniref:ABC transporter ATP-binding protein n=1 Tax=Nocardia sp. CNY236 TaxID=1169152 RepID=UPI000420B3E7|nr:ABC transporter ATP-binding protein [Nocardia sp. CNY236]
MTTPDGAIDPGVAVNVEGLGVTIDGATLVESIDLTAAPKQVTAIVGPNGSGKSTLLRTVYRACKPSAGAAYIDGRDVWKSSTKQMARIRAVVTQHQGDTADFTVAEVVAMGRAPHKSYLQRDSDSDRDIVFAAMRRVGVDGFAERPFTALSGGERQRVLLARALAQQAPVILLDEPTNHLDIHAQLALLHLLRELDTTIVLAIHDLGLALAYADHVIVLQDGRVAAAGEPVATITADLLLRVFGVCARVIDNPLTGRPHVVMGLPPETSTATARETSTATARDDDPSTPP